MDVHFSLFSSGKTIYGTLMKEVRCTSLSLFNTVNPLEAGPSTIFTSLSACGRETCICEGYLVFIRFFISHSVINNTPFVYLFIFFRGSRFNPILDMLAAFKKGIVGGVKVHVDRLQVIF